MKLKATVKRNGMEAKVFHVGVRNYHVVIDDQVMEIHENLSKAVTSASQHVLLGEEELRARLFYASRHPRVPDLAGKKEFDIQLESN